jgi:hypothetical protein
MSTVKEIEAVLPQLTTDDLVRIEKVLHGLDRKRGLLRWLSAGHGAHRSALPRGVSGHVCRRPAGRERRQ